MEITDISKLNEISTDEYLLFPKEFQGETIYHAPSIQFLNYSWEVMLDIINHKIVKIAIFYKTRIETEADLIAKDILNYCLENLQNPVEQKTGFYIWDTSDGNIVLHTDVSSSIYQINLFLTSNHIRNYTRL